MSPNAAAEIMDAKHLLFLEDLCALLVKYGLSEAVISFTDRCEGYSFLSVHKVHRGPLTNELLALYKESKRISAEHWGQPTIERSELYNGLS